jgi:hypothetical protein
MKRLNCKRCGEKVEVEDRRRSAVCANCAEEAWAEKELIEEMQENAISPRRAEQIYAELATDPVFRKGYLHHRALEKAQKGA